MNEKDLERKFSNLEAKLSQNRGYTTELKNKMILTDDILIGHMNGLEKNLLVFGKPVIRLLEMLYSYVWSVSDNKDAIEDMKKDVIELHKVIEKLDGKKECFMCIKEAMCELDELFRKNCKQNNKMFFKVSVVSKTEKKEKKLYEYDETHVHVPSYMIGYEAAENDRCKSITGFSLKEIKLLKEIYLKEKDSGDKTGKKIKIWCEECNDDYYIFESWNGSECPHCGYWNKKVSLGKTVKKEWVDELYKTVQYWKKKYEELEALGDDLEKTQTISEAVKDVREYANKMNIEIKKRNEEDYREIEKNVEIEISLKQIEPKCDDCDMVAIEFAGDKRKICLHDSFRPKAPYITKGFICPKKDSDGEKEMVKKGIGDDSLVDKPEPIRLSSNERVLDVKEGIPSIHSKLSESDSKGKMGKIDCNECDLYGECDHQGAYQINGKWCYDVSDGEK